MSVFNLAQKRSFPPLWARGVVAFVSSAGSSRKRDDGPSEIEGLDGIGGPSGDGGPTGSVALDSRLTAVARRAGTVLEEASSWGVAAFGTGPIARVESGAYAC
jgi:hypothetical protein